MSSSRLLFVIALILQITATVYAYTQFPVNMVMRDFVTLATTVYLPDTIPPPHPVILQRTPYNRAFDDTVALFITDGLGYALVSQNLRGTGGSGGNAQVFLSDGWGALMDGYDCIDWVASQPWCNGKIGMLGASAPGMTQYYAAGTGHPNLTCIAPVLAGPSIYHHVAYQGGCFRKVLVESWLGGLGLSFLADTITLHPNYGPFWAGVNLAEKWDVADIPAIHVAGWFDMYTDGQIEAFCELQARHGNQKLIIMPCGHGSAVGTNIQGDLVLPMNSVISEVELLLIAKLWYDYWLKSDTSGFDLGRNIQYYLTGDCDTPDTTFWNHWEFADNWPVAGMSYQNYFFHSDMSIKPYPPSDSTAFVYTYDPNNPSPTIGGREFIGLGSVGYGPKDQRSIESRPGTLVFSTDPLSEPVKVVGKVLCKLFASSNRLDTDFAVRITDVYPDGRSILMTDGILMARHRRGLDREDLLEPGVMDSFLVDCWSIAHVFNTGHRIRIIVTSSNYPRFERNPNTGATFRRNDPNRLVATNTVYNTSSLSCRLELPVVPLVPLEVDEFTERPTQISLSAYPNPFNSAVRITLEGVGAGLAPALVEIFDLSGRRVAELPEYGTVGAGLAPARNDGANDNEPDGARPSPTTREFVWSPDKSLPSGVYLVRAQVEGNTSAKRIVYMK